MSKMSASERLSEKTKGTGHFSTGDAVAAKGRDSFPKSS
jgi:hypothetical protein